MENGKRRAPHDEGVLIDLQSAKRFRQELIEFEPNDKKKDNQLMETEDQRTSNLQSPIMLLTGHKSEIYSCKFNPDGQTLASVGAERQIFLWNVYDDCKNYSILPGHKGSILDVHYSSDGGKLYTSSTDKSIMVWDVVQGGRIKKLIGHKGVVNSCHPSRKDSRIICSGGDDFCLKLYDLRSRSPEKSFKDNQQILAVTFDEDHQNIIYGGVDNTIKIYDLRKDTISTQMTGLYDSITGLSLSPNGNFVLANSMDNLLSIWDVRPYAPNNRLVSAMQGHSHNFEKNLLKCSWSSDGNYVTCGSADRFVYVWNVDGKIVYKLSGHLGSVNDVQFHPKEPIILSCSNDKQLYLGELEL